jgi:hypothetical protein
MDTAFENDSKAFESHRREPLILDADPDAVVRALEQAEKASGR